MKQLLLFIFLLTAFIAVQAQPDNKKSRFAFVYIPWNSEDEVYEIRIDSGQAPIRRKGPAMTDSSGKPLKFVSAAAALNYMGGIGWKLVQVLADTEGAYGSGGSTVWTVRSYLFKKDD